jgi:hypothetical protein
MGVFDSVFFAEGDTEIMVVASHTSRNIVTAAEFSSVTFAGRISLLGVVKVSADLIARDLIYF